MFEFSCVTYFLAKALVVSIIVRVIYLLIIKNWNYFTERNVQFERGLPVLGTLYKTLLGKASVPEILNQVYRKHSDRKVVGMFEIGGAPSYMVRDVDLIRQITIKDFDYFVNRYLQLDKQQDPLLGRALFSMSNQHWRNMRSTLSPLFTGSKMRHMLTLMMDCMSDFNDFIKKDISSKSNTNRLEYDTMELIMRLTNDIIGSTAFGIQLNSLEDSDNIFYKMGKEIAYIVMSVRTFFLLAFPKLSSWLNLKIIPDHHDQFFRNVIRNTIKERQEQKIVRNDMLHLLLLAKDDKLNELKDIEADQDTGFATISEKMTSKTMEKLKNWTEEDLVAQAVVFFLAGFTGLSNTLCFLCYELSLAPEIQQRLYDEIVETKKELNGKSVTFEALQRMKYLDMCVSEVLRKWPVGTMVDRIVSKQYLFEDNDGTKVLLQPNDILWIPVYAIHHSSKYYLRPEKFDPERFSDENKGSIQTNAYLPFGSGPRACIGNRFALLHLKATIYQILLDFEIAPSSKMPMPLKLRCGTFAPEPVGGFFNVFTIRK